MKVVSVVCTGMQSSSSLDRGGGGWSVVILRPGMGMNYFLVSHFTCMHCGDLNSAHKDFLS